MAPPFIVIPAPTVVIPAKAGIQPRAKTWTPAFAGVTGEGATDAH